MLWVAGKSITFLLDTGATYSVLTSHPGLMFPSLISVMGVDGTRSFPLKTLPLPCILAGQFFSHSFLVIPACPAPLLGRDILSCFKATLTLAPTLS